MNMGNPVDELKIKGAGVNCLAEPATFLVSGVKLWCLCERCVLCSEHGHADAGVRAVRDAAGVVLQH